MCEADAPLATRTALTGTTPLPGRCGKLALVPSSAQPAPVKGTAGQRGRHKAEHTTNPRTRPDRVLSVMGIFRQGTVLKDRFQQPTDRDRSVNSWLAWGACKRFAGGARGLRLTA